MYNNNFGSPISSFSNIKSSLSLTTILTGASKTLNFINQLIPLYYQVSPMVKNAKTMFKITNELKKDDKPNYSNSNNVANNEVYQTTNIEQIKKDEVVSSSNLPNFFL